MELKKIEDSIYHKWYNEDTLIDEKDGVNEAYYIKDLKSIIAKLTSVIESSRPVCPYCKENMEPRNHSHYYSEGSYAIWECGCSVFPDDIADNCYLGH
jgi:hypothetical protein